MLKCEQRNLKRIGPGCKPPHLEIVPLLEGRRIKLAENFERII